MRNETGLRNIDTCVDAALDELRPLKRLRHARCSPLYYPASNARQQTYSRPDEWCREENPVTLDPSVYGSWWL
ncbi:hypothetical protein HaLaN_17130, partial [Haematococcus lacustris]